MHPMTAKTQLPFHYIVAKLKRAYEFYYFHMPMEVLNNTEVGILNVIMALIFLLLCYFIGNYLRIPQIIYGTYRLFAPLVVSFETMAKPTFTSTVFSATTMQR